MFKEPLNMELDQAKTIVKTVEADPEVEEMPLLQHPLVRERNPERTQEVTLEEVARVAEMVLTTIVEE
jgi:hypothetical protein